MFILTVRRSADLRVAADLTIQTRAAQYLEMREGEEDAELQSSEHCLALFLGS